MRTKLLLIGLIIALAPTAFSAPVNLGVLPAGNYNCGIGCVGSSTSVAQLANIDLSQGPIPMSLDLLFHSPAFVRPYTLLSAQLDLFVNPVVGFDVFRYVAPGARQGYFLDVNGAPLTPTQLLTFGLFNDRIVFQLTLFDDVVDPLLIGGAHFDFTLAADPSAVTQVTLRTLTLSTPLPTPEPTSIGLLAVGLVVSVLCFRKFDQSPRIE